jgi:uncharacterized RmlC-like cupin family protein
MCFHTSTYRKRSTSHCLLPAIPLGSVVTFVAVPVLPRACQSGTPCQAAPRFQAILETRTGTSPVCIASQACAAHIGAIVQGLTTWAHHHDITEGQITVLTIDPVLPYVEPQGLVFCIIPLAR